MHCPDCNLELHIDKSYMVIEDGKPVTKQEMICVNPNCIRHKAGVPVKVIEHIHDIQ